MPLTGGGGVRIFRTFQSLAVLLFPPIHEVEQLIGLSDCHITMISIANVHRKLHNYDIVWNWVWKEKIPARFYADRRNYCNKLKSCHAPETRYHLVGDLAIFKLKQRGNGLDVTLFWWEESAFTHFPYLHSVTHKCKITGQKFHTHIYTSAPHQ